MQQSHALVDEFLRDHRQMTRALARLYRAMDGGSLAEVQALAQHLDEVAGPHIDFEEQVLYRLVRAARGGQLARRLHQEHRVVREAVERLLVLRPADWQEATVTALRKKLAVGLQHAESCGTLVSHLAAMSPAEQAEAENKLRQLRADGARWTELPVRPLPDDRP